MKRNPPDWLLPKNLPELVADDEGWEDDRWDPLLLSVFGGTEFQGRAVPMAWQVEFEPYGDEFTEANQKMCQKGIEPDAYRWCDLIIERMADEYPEFLDQLHTEDTERSTCVIWVESEAASKALMMAVWSLLD